MAQDLDFFSSPFAGRCSPFSSSALTEPKEVQRPEVSHGAKPGTLLARSLQPL